MRLKRIATVAALALATALTPLAFVAPAHASLPGYQPLASALSGHQLDVSGGSTSAFAPVIVWWGHGQSNQQWNFPSTDGQTGYIINENSGMCLTTDQVAGDQLYQYPCGGAAAPLQLWLVHTYPVPTPVGTFVYGWFTNPASGLVVDLSQSSYAVGAAVVGWYGTGGLNQSWALSG
jgi:Ricin-type beta-trefoil lectin domain-like